MSNEDDTLDLWIKKHLGNEIPELGLKRIRQFLSDEVELIHGQDCTIVTVAGTNGKGQTIYSLSKLLSQAGIDHTLWSSPHVKSVCERFQHNGSLVEQSRLEELSRECLAQMKKKNVKLSYYEFLFACFLKWSEDLSPRVILLEVGLGGRLDAVNILDADMVLIPSISRDHTEFLGNSYRSILHEKLGVLRDKSLLLTCLSLNYLKEMIKNFPNKREWLDLSVELENFNILESDWESRNQYLAYRAFTHLASPSHKISWMQAQKHLRESILTARGERLLACGIEWTFWAAHNTDGLRKCVQFWSGNSYNNSKPLYDVCLFAISKRSMKEIDSMVRMVIRARDLGIFREVFFCSFDHWRAFDWSEFPSDLPVFDWSQLVKGDSYHGKKVLVLGSFYFLSEVQKNLCSRVSEPGPR